MYVGNYDFWYESNQLMIQLISNKNKKLEQKGKSCKSLLHVSVQMLPSQNKQPLEKTIGKITIGRYANL